jgi:hypothetical protein
LIVEFLILNILQPKLQIKMNIIISFIDKNFIDFPYVPCLLLHAKVQTISSSVTAMEYDKSSLRFLVETCRKNSLTPTQTYEFISTAWPECVTLRRVQQIYAELTVAMEQKEDKRGRPRTSRTDENIALVEECINEDASQSLESIEAQTGIPATTVNRILVDDLGLKWKTAHWLPHKLSDEQKAKRVTMGSLMLKILKKHNTMSHIIVVDEKVVYHEPVNNKRINAAWVPPDGDKPVVYRRTQFSPKTMVVAAMTFTGKVHVEYVERGQSINSDAYIQFLRNVFHNFSRHRDPLKAEDVLLIHDNARVHVSVATRQFLDSRGVFVINQPPYSPDTNALDRFGFRAVEEKRHRLSFPSAPEVEGHVTDVLKGFSSERLVNEFHALLEHLQLIIDGGGAYV